MFTIRNLKTIPAVFVALLALPACTSAQDTADTEQYDCKCKDLITPTQMMDAYWAELSDPSNEVAQADLGWQYLNLITMDGETMPERRLTRLALGEAAFLTYQPGVSRYYFSRAADGHDLIARHAKDRIMQITFRAYDDKPAAKEMVDQFYEQFPPTLLNLRGRNQQIHNFVDWYLAEGRTADAMALIIDELESLPTDAPYRSFSLPADYAEQIAASTQAVEIAAISTAKLEGLKALRSEWASKTHSAEDDPILTSPMPRWYWTAQGIRPGETFMAARVRQLDDMIGKLESTVNEADSG